MSKQLDISMGILANLRHKRKPETHEWDECSYFESIYYKDSPQEYRVTEVYCYKHKTWEEILPEEKDDKLEKEDNEPSRIGRIINQCCLSFPPF